MIGDIEPKQAGLERRKRRWFFFNVASLIAFFVAGLLFRLGTDEAPFLEGRQFTLSMAVIVFFVTFGSLYIFQLNSSKPLESPDWVSIDGLFFQDRPLQTLHLGGWALIFYFSGALLKCVFSNRPLSSEAFAVLGMGLGDLVSLHLWLFLRNRKSRNSNRPSTDR